MGLSSTADIGSRDLPKHEGAKGSFDELAILADILAGPAGDKAKSLSRDLIKSHRSLAGIFMAAEQGAISESQIPPAVYERLRYFRAFLALPPESEVLTNPVLGTSSALVRYLHMDMANLKRENFRVLFLDSGNRLLVDRVMWEGTINKVQVHPREIVGLAIESGATALILAHNHPSGRPRPSGDDVKITRQIVSACAALEIIVHDHLIVAREGVCSMAFSQPSIFSRSS